MTVSKLLTGQDKPLSSIEMVLNSTYAIAKQRFEQQQRRARKG